MGEPGERAWHEEAQRWQLMHASAGMQTATCPRTCVKRSACSRPSNCCTSASPPSACPKRSHSVATPASATQV